MNPGASSNDRITVLCDMWCCCKPEMRERPLPVDTQVGWLKGEYRDGTVWVWFHG